MLLPGTRVTMTLFDQGRILIPTLSGFGLAFKLVTKAAATVLAGFSGMFGFLILLAGTIGYGVKAFFGYLNTKDKYQLNLTRSLYFQNLDNNSGVFSPACSTKPKSRNFARRCWPGGCSGGGRAAATTAAGRPSRSTGPPRNFCETGGI